VQLRDVSKVATAIAKGDLGQKITVDVKGEILQIKDVINTMVDQLGSFASEVTRVAREVGTEGKLGGQAQVQGVAGTWKDLTDNVNQLAGNLTVQLRDVSKVATAISKGDLGQKVTVEVKGEILQIKDVINTMVDQLGSFASEVTRVAREVGTEGKLGGQAHVQGVSGTWKDLTDNVNLMASNLTDQVRGIARVVTAVANGDLKKKLTVEAKGEIAALADTINNMIDTLAIFADQVTSVAREVGVEGKLGGQARVPGASGTWKDLTENVNQLAANLTTQVRAIADVATAVTKGDLTRSIGVAAEGEVAILKDNINEMIRNLRHTTDKNTEQDWLKTNLAKFTRMLQGQREMLTVCKLILSELAPLVKAQHGVFYIKEEEQGEVQLTRLASYAFNERKNLSQKFRLGEGLVGECALEKERILLTNVPGDYVQINSGLGRATPLNIVVLPVMFESATKAVIELASFERFSPTHLAFLEQLTESIGIVLHTIEANSRTEALLQQSQKMAQELQNQQDELQQTNEELEEKARLLAQQNTEVERKNLEVEAAKQSLEEKATQLSLTSKYKSEFLANMSHELRTPLNSLLLLSQHLRDNPDGNLTDRQVEYARTIVTSGNDLLNLINDILDLSKVESGTATADIGEVAFSDIAGFVEQTFRHMAEDRKLEFSVELDTTLPRSLFTDERRVKQIIKNLLSNAFKFTSQGQVALRASRARAGWSPRHPILREASDVIAFAISDTGIGIPKDKQKVIFEAFQQADGTTSRKYGGTGLGLAISRELARLLGGEITLRSRPGQGSVFTLYLPLHYSAPATITGLAAYGHGDAGEDDESYAAVAYGGGSAGADAPPAILVGEASPVARIGAEALDDDRTRIQPGDRVMLIVEDSSHLARMLRDLARDHGFKALVAMQGQTALTLARQYAPSAITLDIQLPDANGLAILDHLKQEPATRHIPVHALVLPGEGRRARQLGAVVCTTKPLERDDLSDAFTRVTDFLGRTVVELLVVEADPAPQDSIARLLDGEDVRIVSVDTAADALAAVAEKRFDIIVLDLALRGGEGFELLEALRAHGGIGETPAIIYNARELTRDEEGRLERAGRSLNCRRVQSPDRLLDAATLLLHRSEADLPESRRRVLEQVRDTDPLLAGRTVLIVDDDIRNIFSLTAVLERHRMRVLTAENGRDAIELLRATPGVDLVLMDVMMPEMDGYETTRAIRKLPKFQSLPIISLTAKAMKGDREKCIEAGASDYIPKPVNTEQLRSLLRVWLHP
jgi:signal transduction histidine kinase/DNA-binding response OmpR family regulator/HAMP domain-containing protein